MADGPRTCWATGACDGVHGGAGPGCGARAGGGGRQVAVSGRRPERVTEVAGSLPEGAASPATSEPRTGPQRSWPPPSSSWAAWTSWWSTPGRASPGGMVDKDAQAWDAGYASVLRPALALARAAVPALRRSVGGRLVFVTARSVLETTPDLALSGVFRSGVAAAAAGARRGLAPEVLVNVVVPGQFDTGRLRRFEEFAAERDGSTVAEFRRRHEAAAPLGRVGRAESSATSSRSCAAPAPASSPAASSGSTAEPCGATDRAACVHRASPGPCAGRVRTRPAGLLCSLTVETGAGAT